MSAVTLAPAALARATRSSAPVACAHCGLGVPPGLLVEGRESQFCCHGCETAYGVITGCGLERYYALRDEASSPIEPARATAKKYAEFDDPTFRGLYARELEGTRRSIELFLQGVHCAACVWLVEKLPRVVPGVVEARLDVRRSLVTITWDDALVTLSRVARALDSLGYPPHPARDATAREARKRDDRRHLINIGVAGACAGNVMLLALALYAGTFDVLEPAHRALFRWASMGLTLVSLVWPGRVFFRGAWAAIRARAPHLDVPIAMGLGIGGAWSIISTLRGTGEVYFDSLSVLVFALLVGRWVQTRQQRWAADSVELLFSLTPTSARVVERDASGVESIRVVSIEALGVGGLVEVRAGDSIPADGVIELGHSSIDASLLTGESRPVEVGPGERVAAGAVNRSGTLRVRVEATGAQTRVGRLMRLVEEGASRRAPIISLADSLGNWFVGVMLGLAAITLGAWLWIDPAHPGRAIGYAAALLIVTCPCGLGLATPLAMTVAIGRAAKRGILVKGGDAIERLATPGRVFLDKTGTLTQGRLALLRWVGDESVKPLLAALEGASAHPIAVALVRDLGGAGTPPPAEASGVTQTIGGGVEGECAGKRIVAGAPSFVLARSVAGHEWAVERAHELARESLTPVLVAVEGRVVALAGLGDPLRAEAHDAIDGLRASGWDIGVLSGDHAGVVRGVAWQLGIADGDACGGVTPEGKVAAIVSTPRRKRRPVVMVGDGVNDAAALASADVGIAVHGGAEASLAAADVYLNRPGLGAIADLLGGSRRTMRVIHVMFGVSIAYNVVAAGLSMSGLINPLLAAVIMPASSLSVVALAIRLRTF